MFFKKIMKELSNKIKYETKSGCIIITITYELEGIEKGKFEIINTLRRYMSWGIVNFFIYIKK